MRLLVLTPEFHSWGGGIGTYYAGLLPALAKQGVAVRVVEGSASAAAPSAEKAMRRGIVSERLELARLARWFDQFNRFAAAPVLRRHLAAAWAMWEQACDGEDFDIVEATDWGMLFVPPIVTGTHPTIALAHASGGQISTYDPVAGDETSDALTQMIERSVLAKATQLQTYANANSAFWSAETGRNVEVMRPAWSPAQRPALSGSIGARGLVVGRVQSWKGPETLCEALRLMGAAAPRIDWVGRETSWSKRGVTAGEHLAQRFPDVWGPLISHAAPLPPAEVAAMQGRAAFNLIPSKWDVFNFTAAEALASGRPTIVSQGAGASELIEDGVNGFTFPAGDSAALAEVIQRVMALSPKLQQAIARYALATVRRELDPALIANQRMAAYRDAIEQHGTDAVPVSGWLAQICSPQPAVAQECEFLEALPLRVLLNHFTARVARRLRPT